MEGGYLPVALYLDAKSVFAVVSATFVKQPAEKSLLCHLQYLRELMDKHVLQYLFWLDTRDMGADGLTKGAVARSLLHMYMDGIMTLQHEHSQWGSKAAVMRASLSRFITFDTCWEMHACIDQLCRGKSPCHTA